MRPIQARYENGSLRPMEPLALRAGERVTLVVMRRPDPSRWDVERLARGGGEDDELAESGLDEWADGLQREDEG